ncbi:hypothetical protein BJ944DRAFT_274010 [Cunninghamella echinulata]|nr:hypothetical protein BJ944DRAFT_274010 [Cunninghamella echinulata]
MAQLMRKERRKVSLKVERYVEFYPISILDVKTRVIFLIDVILHKVDYGHPIDYLDHEWFEIIDIFLYHFLDSGYAFHEWLAHIDLLIKLFFLKGYCIPLLIFSSFYFFQSLSLM